MPAGRAGGQHRHGLVQVPVGGGLGNLEAPAEPGDIGPVPEPRQGEDGLVPAGQCPAAARGADLPPPGQQQLRDVPDQFHGNAGHDTIGDHAEPLPVGMIFGETSSTGSSASLRDRVVCPRVCPNALMSQRTNAEIDRQVSDSAEVAELVGALERQYDAYAAAGQDGAGGGNGLLDGEDIPTADELGAQFERFLAERQQRGDSPDR